MNEDARRLFLMVLITVGFMLFYTTVIVPRINPPPAEDQVQGTEAAGPAAPAAPSGDEAAALAGSDEATAEAPTPPPADAVDVRVRGSLYDITLTTWGGRIKSMRLLEYPESKLKDSQLDGMEKAARSALAKARAGLAKSDPDTTAPVKLQQLSANVAEAELELRRVAFLRSWLASDPNLSTCEMIPFQGPTQGHYPPSVSLVDANGEPRVLDNLLYTPSIEGDITLGDDEVVLQLTAVTDDGLKVTRTYTFMPDSYNIGVFVSVENASSAEALPAGALRLSYGPDVGLVPVKGFRGRAVLSPATAARTASGNTYLTWEKKPHAEPTHFAPPVAWTAVCSKYFVAAMAPVGESADVASADTVKSAGEEAATLQVTHEGLAKGDAVSVEAVLYAGPKDRARLASAGHDFSRLIYYGKLTPISNVLYWILQVFYRILHNYGIAIMCLALAIKIVFYPLTHKSFESMRKMQEDMKRVQPEVDKIKEKYRDNPQKLNKEMMACYRKHGVNPLAGCKGSFIPLLLQMPVFFSLYGLLPNAIELRGAPFFWWVQDLSQPDPWILPILMGGSMYLTQKITTPPSPGGSGQEQKMMQIMMPVLFAWIFRTLPSGLALYWLAYNILTAAQQKLTHRRTVAAA